MKSSRFVVVTCCILLRSIATAAPPESIPTEQALKLATKLTDQATKIANPQIKIDPDMAKANGFHVPGTLGALVVPQKDLKEGADLAAKFKSESGASLAYLFLHNVVPIVDGKRIDVNRLRTMKIMDDQGVSHTVYTLLLAVRQPAPDDYRLHVYGQDAKPLIDAKFSATPGNGTVPVAVELKNPNESTKEGAVAVTVFGQFQATFPAQYTEDRR